jgi:hypothetical protein
MVFYGCRFIGVWIGATAPSAIEMTATQMIKIHGCSFEGGFSGDVIDIGAGIINGLEIVGNKIIGGADNGIVATGTMTMTGSTSYGLIANNIIKVADKVIDDGSDDVILIVDNRCQSDTTAGADAYVINDDWAMNNIVCCSDEVIMLPALTNVTT